jgi:hypothetical protein
VAPIRIKKLDTIENVITKNNNPNAILFFCLITAYTAQEIEAITKPKKINILGSNTLTIGKYGKL